MVPENARRALRQYALELYRRRAETVPAKEVTHAVPANAPDRCAERAFLAWVLDRFLPRQGKYWRCPYCERRKPSLDLDDELCGRVAVKFRCRNPACPEHLRPKDAYDVLRAAFPGRCFPEFVGMVTLLRKEFGEGVAAGRVPFPSPAGHRDLTERDEEQDRRELEEWKARTNAEHMAECADPDCDWYCCRLARGWTWEQIHADTARAQEEALRAREEQRRKMEQMKASIARNQERWRNRGR